MSYSSDIFRILSRAEYPDMNSLSDVNLLRISKKDARAGSLGMGKKNHMIYLTGMLSKIFIMEKFMMNGLE